MLTSLTHLLVIDADCRTYSRGPRTKSWGPVVINIEKELLDWDGKTGGAQYTGMLEEELLCKQESGIQRSKSGIQRRGEGFWGMAASSPFCHRCFICSQMFQMLEPPTLPWLPVDTITDTSFSKAFSFLFVLCLPREHHPSFNLLVWQVFTKF